MVATTHRACGRSQKGQALLEMALVTPLLLALLLGVIELGRYAYFSILVGNAAHAGAAYGAQGPAYAADAGDIQQAADRDFGRDSENLVVQSWTSCGCDSGSPSWIPAWTGALCTANRNPSLDTGCSNGNSGHWVVTVSVTTSAQFQPHFPGLPESIRVNGAATMRVAQQ